MFGRSKPFFDPELGTLHRSRGLWRGTIHLDPDGEIALTVAGPRSSPDPASVAVARTIAAEYQRCRAAISAGLAEHRATSLEANEPTALDANPAPSSAAVIDFDGTPTIQLAYHVDWDDDHILGACLRDGKLIELNGSILEP